MNVLLEFDERLWDKVRDWADSLKLTPAEFCRLVVREMVDPEEHRFEQKAANGAEKGRDERC